MAAYGQAVNTQRISASTPLASCTLSEEELKAVDASVRAGHICSSVYFQSIGTQANAEFVRDIKQRYGVQQVTSADAEASFIAVLLLAEAIHLADTDDVQQVRSAAVQSRLNALKGQCGSTRKTTTAT